MSNLYIWEFSEVLVRDGTQIPQAPGVVQQLPVPIDNGSNQSSPFQPGTAYIAITADVTFSFVIGPNPVATTNNYRIGQGLERLYGVNPGDRIAVTANV